MQKTHGLEQVEREFGVCFGSSDEVSQFGGLKTLTYFLEKGNFKNRLAELFGKEKGRTILQTMLSVVGGAKTLEEIERVGKDELIKQFICNPVVATQIARDFKGFTHGEIEAFHEFNVNLSALTICEELSLGSELTLDVDATSVEKYGEQEGVEKGFIEKDKIEDCYQYLFFRCHELNTFLYGTIRSGSAHSQNGFCGYLKRLLPLVSGSYQVRLRGDSAYFNEEAFDIAKDPITEASLFIKAAMSVSRLGLATNSKELVWIAHPEDPNIAFASYVTKTQKGTIYREIYKRTLIETDQLLFPGIAEYRYDCLATNDLVMKEWEAFSFYNGRAHIENNIREFKYDYQLGKIVTQSFMANDAITQTLLLTYLLIAHFKSKVLPKEMQKMQLNTLRWRVFNIPGRVLCSARRELVRIYNLFVPPQSYCWILNRIKSLQSWVLFPPPLEFEVALI